MPPQLRDSWPFGSRPNLSWENFLMKPTTTFLSPEDSQRILIAKWYLNVGIDCYFTGNFQKAYTYFMTGAKKGKCIRCITWIGICFLNNQEIEKAKSAFENALKNGDELAPKILSKLYEREKDNGRAAWYRGMSAK